MEQGSDARHRCMRMAIRQAQWCMLTPCHWSACTIVRVREAAWSKIVGDILLDACTWHCWCKALLHADGKVRPLVACMKEALLEECSLMAGAVFLSLFSSHGIASGTSVHSESNACIGALAPCRTCMCVCAYVHVCVRGCKHMGSLQAL
eukprot:1151147-Pelagomonas_calceolata.AAC.4